MFSLQAFRQPSDGTLLSARGRTVRSRSVGTVAATATGGLTTQGDKKANQGKGTRMSRTERTANAASMPMRGFFAVLRALLAVQGIRAPRFGLSNTVGPPARGCRRALLALAPLVLAAGFASLVMAPAASAEECSSCRPWWHLSLRAAPSVIPPGGEGKLVLQAMNFGDAESSGMVVLTDTLPAGVKVLEEEVEPGVFRPEVTVEGIAFFCKVAGQLVTCEWPAPKLPYQFVEMVIGVRAGASSEPNTLEVSGGGAPGVSLSRPIQVGASVPFGFEAGSFQQLPEDEGGGVDARAGSHPFAFTTSLAFNQTSKPVVPPALPKSVRFQLPVGLVGNATLVPGCSEADFNRIVGGFANSCPDSSAIGVAIITFDDAATLHTFSEPVFNLAPAHGEPARFGFSVLKTPVTIDTSVRSGRDYGVTATAIDIPESVNFISETVSFWGVPSDPAHEHSRGYGCLAGGQPFLPPCNPVKSAPEALLTNPTSCAIPWEPTVEGESWPLETGGPGGLQTLTLPPTPYRLQDPSGDPLSLTGCDHLSFNPSIQVSPDVQDASTSTGLTVDVHVPQEVNEDPEGLASSSVKDITVALPEGVQVNPSDGNGLEACSEGQVGFEVGHGVGGSGFEEFDPEHEPHNRTALFTPTLPEPLAPGLELGEKGFCPNASKVANVQIHSPLIANPLKGSVYLASQNANPFGSLLAMYIVAEDPVSGTLVKLPGTVSPCRAAGEVIAGMTCAAAGQLITTFLNNPQLPFEDAVLEFFGGERAPLATPARCGSYTTNAAFVPWSATPGPEGEAAATVHASSTFRILHGPGGSPCPGPTLPFTPTLTAGTPNNNAGAFSPLLTSIARQDGEQNLQSVVIHFPPGVSGSLTGVKLCPEAQANEGTCGPESLIGETTVSAGVGSDPVSVKGGRVYLTEKYQGAPFGLSIVNPVKTGPFDLEHDTSNPAQNPACDCVVVRGKLDLDPVTAALTFTSDPSGPHAIPSIIDGIPVQIKTVNVIVNRPNFTFNPTNCDPQSITGLIAGTEGAGSPVSVPFQPTNCASLKYTPTLSVSTAGRASKLNGASLFFKIAYPKGSVGTQSWMKLMKFDIPKQLPARLTTIQQACLAETFEHNRAACPAASIIGHLVVHTPVLPVPLEGPLYFVSYGDAAFPDAVAVLHGYGLTIESHGHTFINNKTGVTSATFESVPDVPFESIEVTVPQGQFSEFGANLPKGSLNFCGQHLTMPILFKAQNGMEIHRNVPVAVTGCRTLTRKQKLAAALKACHHKHGKKRAVCEKAARRAFGARKASTRKSAHRGHR